MHWILKYGRVKHEANTSQKTGRRLIKAWSPRAYEVAQNTAYNFIQILNKTPVSAGVSEYFCSKLPANTRVSSIFPVKPAGRAVSNIA